MGGALPTQIDGVFSTFCCCMCWMPDNASVIAVQYHWEAGFSTQRRGCHVQSLCMWYACTVQPVACAFRLSLTRLYTIENRACDAFRHLGPNSCIDAGARHLSFGTVTPSVPG